MVKTICSCFIVSFILIVDHVRKRKGRGNESGGMEKPGA